MNAPLLQVGVALPRRDAHEKVSGRAIYGPDIALPGMLHAKLLRSPRAHARVVAIDAAAARVAEIAEFHGCVVATGGARLSAAHRQSAGGCAWARSAESGDQI